MRLPSIDPLYVVVSVLLLIAIPMAVIDDHNKRQHEQAEIAKQRDFEYKALTQTIAVKPWDKYIECGIQGHDLRECDMRYWPGQVYPDHPIPGEKTPGIVWTCYNEHADPRYPPHRECYADASPERKKAYPCPKFVTGPRLSRDKYCARAKTLPPDRFSQ